MATAHSPAGSTGLASNVGWQGLGLTGLGIADALLLVWGSAPGSSVARQLSAVVCGASVGAAALAWITLERRFERMPVACVLGLALVLRLIAIQASPLLEDDHFRYLWDGLRTATGFDPYRLPPSAFFGRDDLPARWQDILGGINNPDVPTIYGPLLQWLFALAWWIAPGRLEAIQSLLLIVDMAVLVVLACQNVGARWLLVYAVHPLVLKEAMASAHPDGLVALFLLLALLAWQRHRAAWVGVLLGLAVGSKVAALVVVPLLAMSPRSPALKGTRWALAVGAGFGATLTLLYVPFILAGGSDASALGTFGSQWRFNPLLYRIVEAAVPGAVTRPLAALLITAGIVLIAWHWRQNMQPGASAAPPPLDAALVLLLLLSPVVNPWYWLWALALSVRLGRGWAVAGGVIAVLSCLNSTVLFEAQFGSGSESAAPYLVPWPLALVQVLALLAAFLVNRGQGHRWSSVPRVSQ